MLWFAGKNKHTGEWITGGTAADYPVEHWDRYVVDAKNRNEALKNAKAERRKRQKVAAIGREV
jgi:hypothetical protein